MSNHVARRSSDSDISPSSFTPVNGREQTQQAGSGSNRPSPPSEHSAEESNTRPSSAGESITVDTSPSTNHNALRPSTNGDGGNPPKTETISPDSPEHPVHKRKRSASAEANGHPQSSRYDYSPPKRDEQTQRMADRALHVLRDTDRTTQSQYTPPPNGVQHGHNNSWQSVSGGQYTPNGARMDVSESHLAEALQNATHQENDGLNDRRAVPRQSEASSADGYGQDQTGSGQSGPKRKRVFSNRTKTGCMTCRRRKKKCDEAVPHCNNCVRGGFSCEGYSNRNNWNSKPSYGKGPIPLQSKNGYTVVDEPVYPPDMSSPNSKRSSMQYEASQARPMTIEDGDGHGQYTASPQSAEPRIRSGYPGQQQQQWPHNGHPSHGHDRSLPSFSALERGDAVKASDYGHQQQVPRQIAMSQPPAHPAPNASQWQPQPAQRPPQEYRQAYPPPQIETNYAPPPPPPPPRISSTYEPVKSGPKTFTNEQVEKSKMLRNYRFNYFDNTLKNERQRCENALKRYNAACEQSSGVSDEEAQKLLEKIVDPSKDKSHHFLAPCDNKGHLGPGVKIEGPFTCSYGYNLKVDDNVCILHHCNIDDAAEVKIGPRTYIGPNVTILTTEYSKEMIDRKGTEGVWVAKPVIIAGEVVIGANCIIYPGVKLGRGSTVEPGAVVRESLEENGCQMAVSGSRYGH